MEKYNLVIIQNLLKGCLIYFLLHSHNLRVLTMNY